MQECNEKGSIMRTTRTKLLAGLLAAATLFTTIPVTPASAGTKTAPAVQSLQSLGILDADGEENTANDLPDRNPEAAAQAKPYAADNGDLIVAIDAGHGGTDSGATYDGMEEKTVNLKIAKYIRDYMEDYAGVQVYLTRSSDKALGLSERVEQSAAAGADVFISIHNNASSNLQTSGSMVFYPNSSYRQDLSEEGAGLSQCILNRLTELGLPDLGIRTRNSESGNKYDDGSLADYYGVIRNAKLTGITGIIVEHAFVSSAADRKNYLGSDAKLKKLALADAKGIADYYGLKYIGLTKPAVTLTAENQKKLTVSWDEQDVARGYIVYRSDSKNGTYTRIGKVSGGENTSYTDATAKQGQTYYYKVRAYRDVSGSVYYSEYSAAIHGSTIGGTRISTIKQMSAGYLRLTWDAYADGDGYAIYRSEDGGSYKRIATITDAAKTAYNDRTVEQGTTYTYKIRTRNVLYKNEGFGKCSATVTVDMLIDPVMKRLDVRDDGTIKVVWTKSIGTSKYVVQRATQEDGVYQTVATITDDTKNYYVDRNAERGMTYYYKVNAYNQQDLIKGSTGYVDPIGEKNMQIPELTSVRITKSKPGIYLSWTSVAGANGYRIYRSTKENSGYAKVITIKGNETFEYIDESPLNAGTTYYYKVKAYVYNSAGTAWSDLSNIRSATAGYSIMGDSNTTAKKMAAWYTARGGEYPSEIYSDYGAETLQDFCKIVYEEATAEGVRAEVVFAQVCKETGFLRFGGDVEPEQCNFAGIGATGGGVQGASFDDVRTGIRAQVQHLKAYASDEPLNNECVDPRFSYVKRGTAIYVEWLGIQENPTGAGWATGKNYGYSLRDDYIRSLLGQ